MDANNIEQNDRRELSRDELEQVHGGAFLRGQVVGGGSPSIGGLSAGGGSSQESTTTLNCIDTDEGTLWGCKKSS